MLSRILPVDCLATDGFNVPHRSVRYLLHGTGVVLMTLLTAVSAFAAPEDGAPDGLAVPAISPAPDEPAPEPVEKPAQYLVDLVVFARDSVDTSAEHWDNEEPPPAGVLHLFFPDFSRGTGSIAGAGLSYASQAYYFGADNALKTSRLQTPIDQAMPRIRSLNAKTLIRRQWVFNHFDITNSPQIRLNDSQVYLPKSAPPSPPDLTRAGEDGAGALERALGPALIEDLPRCSQDNQRRLVVEKYDWPAPATVVSQPDGGVTLYDRDRAKAMFEDSNSSVAEAKAPPSLSLKDSTQLALYNPGTVAQPGQAAVLEEIDLAGPNANRIDGYIRVFLSRYHHAELHLQFLRPFLTDAVTNGQTTPSPRRACLLAFVIQENRRLKNDEIHYFDHPAFSAILFFTKLKPPPVINPDPGVEVLPGSQPPPQQP